MFENINYAVLNIAFLLMIIFIGFFIAFLGIGINEFLGKRHYKYINKEVIKLLEKDESRRN